MNRNPFLRVILVCAATAASLAPAPARAQAIIKVSDTVNIKFGFQLQAWADFQELTNATGTDTINGYQQNLFIRRGRFIVAGNLAKDVTFFFLTDVPNLGKNKSSGTALSSGFIVQDAFVQWKVANEFQLQGGFFLVPLGRATLASTSTFITLDAAPAGSISNAATQSSGFRDTGFGATGFFLKDHLLYRAGVFQGERQPGSRNAFRYAGRVQYDLFDTETGYVYTGTNLGKRKVVAFGLGSDNQGDYHAYTADAFADIPVGPGDAATGRDAVTGQFGFFHYDGQTRLPGVARQNLYLFEAGYYCKTLKAQPFFQFQRQDYSDSVNDGRTNNRFQAGLNYYVSGQNLKFTFAYTRVVPNLSELAATNEFTVQLQAFYF